MLLLRMKLKVIRQTSPSPNSQRFNEQKDVRSLLLPLTPAEGELVLLIMALAN